MSACHPWPSVLSSVPDGVAYGSREGQRAEYVAENISKPTTKRSCDKMLFGTVVEFNAQVVCLARTGGLEICGIPAQY